MLFEKKEIRLNDGRTAVLRSAEVADAQALLDYLKITAAETPFLLRTPEECTFTLEQEEQYVETDRSSETQCTICCFVDGQLAGNCIISRLPGIKRGHRGNIGIALMKSYWGLGIGTALLEEMIQLGARWGLEQLELEVMQGNAAAIGLYEKMGFQLCATRPNAFRLPDGSSRDELLMVRKI